MSLLSCLRCATKFAVGLLHCPHCLSEDFEEDGVGKITVAGGASLPAKGAAAPAVAPEPEPAAPEAPAGAEPFVLKTDLQDQARELGLPVSGTKAELASAIAAAPEPEPEAAPKAAPSLSGPAKSG